MFLLNLQIITTTSSEATPSPCWSSCPAGSRCPSAATPSPIELTRRRSWRRRLLQLWPNLPTRTSKAAVPPPPPHRRPPLAPVHLAVQCPQGRPQTSTHFKVTSSSSSFNKTINKIFNSSHNISNSQSNRSSTPTSAVPNNSNRSHNSYQKRAIFIIIIISSNSNSKLPTETPSTFSSISKSPE